MVELPGVQDPAKVKEILQATATLEYRLVDDKHSAIDAKNGKVPPGSELRFDRDGQPVLLKRGRIITGFLTDKSRDFIMNIGRFTERFCRQVNMRLIIPQCFHHVI